MFQGSKHVPEDTFFKFLEEAGGTSVNGTTNDDRTNYFETVPSNRLALALWLESDRMGFLLDHVDQATFDSQRDVVKNERRQSYENQPYGLVYKFMREALYPVGHPYHHLTIGTPEDLDNAKLDDVRAFFRANYVPNNATLVLDGDFEPTKAMELVTKYYAAIPAGPKRELPKAPPAVIATHPTRLDVSCSAELERVTIAWTTPAFFQPGDADLDVVARILSSGKSSRLYKKFVYDAQTAQDVSAGQGSQQYSSSFLLSATAKPGKSLDDLKTGLLAELDRLGREGPTAEELSRAKIGILSTSLFGLERSSSRADELNMFRHYTGDANYFAKDRARYDHVDANAVKAAARSLDSQRAVTIFVHHDGKAPIAGRLDKTSP
jgi:predicted Zn-dependent peptidase